MPIAEHYICSGNKYTFRDGTITLPVLFNNLPNEIEINGYRLSLKSNFHISLVCLGKIIEKHNVSIPNFENLVIKDFCNFTKNNDVSLVKYNRNFRFVAQNEKRSVILMAEVSNLYKFFDVINRKYRLSIENQPTHITLYTLQPNMGIFITDSKDIEQLTEEIENPTGSIFD